MATHGGRRCFTVMIVPHSEEGTYSLRMPLFAVQLAVALVILVVAGCCVLAYAYMMTAAEAREAASLREANQAQQEEIDALAMETQRMMEQVLEVDALVDMLMEQYDLGIDGSGPSGATPEDNPENNAQDGLALEYIGFERYYESRSYTGGILERAALNIATLQDLVPDRSDALEHVGDYLEKERAKPAIWPARGRLSSGFGMRRVPYAQDRFQFHTGVDIIGAHGSSVWATADGEVVFTGYRGSYGNTVIVDHGLGYETLYAHLSGFDVQKGDSVSRGESIGFMGSSGRTTGTHLHYEVHYRGTPVNPYKYMQQP